MKITFEDLKRMIPFWLPIPQRKPKLCPAEQSRQALGLNGQTGEELIQALITAYNAGEVIHVYQVLLNVNVDSDSFYKLQGEAWGVSRKSQELSVLADQSERMVRAVACMAQK